MSPLQIYSKNGLANLIPFPVSTTAHIQREKAETMHKNILTYVTYNARFYISYIGIILSKLHTLWLQFIDIINLKMQITQNGPNRPNSTKELSQFRSFEMIEINLIWSDRPQEIPRNVTEKVSNTCPSSAAAKELFCP